MTLECSCTKFGTFAVRKAAGMCLRFKLKSAALGDCDTICLIKIKLIAIVALCFLLSPQNLYRWSGHGHRIIASIAFLLNDGSKLRTESRTTHDGSRTLILRCPMLLRQAMSKSKRNGYSSSQRVGRTRLRNIKRVARDGDWRKCWVGRPAVGICVPDLYRICAPVKQFIPRFTAY